MPTFSLSFITGSCDVEFEVEKNRVLDFFLENFICHRGSSAGEGPPHRFSTGIRADN